MNIGLDVDGVLADFESRFFYVMAMKYGIPKKDVKLFQWDFRQGLCLTDDEEKQIMNDIFESNNFFPPVSGAIEGCHQLKDMGHDLVVLTARKDKNNTIDWLERNSLGWITPYHIDIDVPPVVDVLLDDSPKKIARLRAYVGQAFLFTTPQNKECMDMYGRYQRINDWPEFLEWVRQHDEQNKSEKKWEEILANEK